MTTQTAFTLERRMLDLRFRQARLTSRAWITPQYVRLRLEGEELRGFDSPGADDHLRLFFAPADASADEVRAAPSREYTPLEWDAEEGTLDIEFVLHGDDGVAGPWAASAPLGSAVAVGGPRGSMVLEGCPDAWFLAGDETAVPAMRRFARSMDADAVGRILVEVPDAAHEIPIDAPAGVEVRQIHRGEAPAGSALAAALNALGAQDRPHGSIFGFVAAEQAIVRPARALLLDRWGLTTDQIVAKGYWKSGETEYHAPH
ncbi:siderophore-interacting protein [Microbacterium koreense]|uniref:Siderophore-interacting protein n=1 Tax=Microbacterium koreense TaxID=323761 RepID=A0ABW2ZPY9_9MICO